MPLVLSTGSGLGSWLPPWTLSPGQTSVTFNPVLPKWNSAAGWNPLEGKYQDPTGKTIPNWGPQLTLTTTNRKGLLKPAGCLTVGDVLAPWKALEPLGTNGLTINGINFCYDFAKGEWTVSGILELPTPGPNWPDRFSASLTYKGFQLEKFDTQVDGLNVKVAPYVYFQRVGVGASWDLSKSPPLANAIRFNGGLSFGPQLNQHTAGPLVKEFPFIDGVELAGMNFEGVGAPAQNPFELSLNGNIVAFRRTILQMTLAGGYVNWWPTTGRFDWGGNLKDWPLPLSPSISVNADLKGFLDTHSAGTMQLIGTGEMKGPWGPALLEARVLLNNNVVGACSTVMGVGFVYNFTTGQTGYFKAGQCGLGDYELPDPAAGRARDQARVASAVGIRRFSFRIPRGLSSTVLAIRGRAAAPFLALIGPGGERISTPSTGALVNSRAWIYQRTPTNTTYIALAHPAPGDWTIRTQAGSSAIANVLEANPAPAPKITAKVGLAGCRQQITYTLHAVSGDHVALYAQNGSQRTFLGDARSGTRRLHFTPALTGIGQIVAITSHDEIPNPQRILATFNPAAYRRAATPHAIRARKGTLTWTAACGARSYTIQIKDRGTTIQATTRTNHLKLPKLHGTINVTVAAHDLTGTTTTRARLHS